MAEMITQNENNMASYANATNQIQTTETVIFILESDVQGKPKAHLGPETVTKMNFCSQHKSTKMWGGSNMISLLCIWPMAHISSQSTRL